MPFTYDLLNDDTTLSLNDGSAYKVLQNGFAAPPPARRMAMGGANLFRHGSDLLERKYENRQVTLRVQVLGATQNTLITNIQAIHDLLERAAEYSITGLGSQVKLRRQWNNATLTSDFLVLEGVFTIDEGTSLHVVNTNVIGTLTLLCQPFIEGAAETVENYIRDPSFEVAGTALADWTAYANGASAGSSTRVTTDAKYGAASLQIERTGGADTNGLGRYQDITVVAAQVWSFGWWVKVTALANAKAMGIVEWLDGGSAVISTISVERTTTSTGYVLLSLANETAPALAVTARCRSEVRATSSGGTGTARFDGLMAVKASSLPTTWASGREIRNHFDDDGQLHINYLDIYDMGGEVPAKLQIKLTENENHAEIWAGARHAGRLDDTFIFIEGESGTVTSLAAPANFTLAPSGSSNTMGTASDGTNRHSTITRDNVGAGSLPVDTYFRHNFAITTLPKGQYRVLVRVNFEDGSAAIAWAAGDIKFGMGWEYGAVVLLDKTNPDVGGFVNYPDPETEQSLILDLGTITIPPIKTPEGQTDATFTLHIFEHVATARSFGNADFIRFDIDYVLLQAVDMGSIYVEKTAGTDVVLLDSRSLPKGVWILNTSDVVQSFPSDQLGSSPEAHPDGSRVYFITQNVTAGAGDKSNITWGFTASITVVPRYLAVR